MKQLLILSILISMNAFSAECKLTGILESDKKIETSFVTSTSAQCKALAQRTRTNHFFGLVEQGDQLVETVMRFKQEETLTDTITFRE
jgi:hypothetical protein